MSEWTYTTPTIPGDYRVKKEPEQIPQHQIDDWLNEYRALQQRVKWLQKRLLDCRAITRKDKN